MLCNLHNHRTVMPGAAFGPFALLMLSYGRDSRQPSIHLVNRAAIHVGRSGCSQHRSLHKYVPCRRKMIDHSPVLSIAMAFCSSEKPQTKLLTPTSGFTATRHAFSPAYHSEYLQLDKALTATMENRRVGLTFPALRKSLLGQLYPIAILILVGEHFACMVTWALGRWLAATPDSC